MITAGELQSLEKFGVPTATPEVLHDLCEALLAPFGALHNAFEFLKSTVGADRISFEDFEAGLRQATADKKVKAKSNKIKDWLKKKTRKDVEAVFASINPFKTPTIGLDDFLTLSLHSAMLSVQRVEHFQNWLFDQFGRTEASMTRAFEAIDAKRRCQLTDKNFVDAVKKIGYGPGPDTARSIFALLDTDFNGQVTEQEFQAMKDFNGRQMLNNLQAIRDNAINNYGGLDECFESLVRADREEGGRTDDVRSVSFGTFLRECAKGPLGQNLRPEEVPVLFLFLDEATGAHSDGFLTWDEWCLLRAFDATAMAGCPARLRAFLERRFGSISEAFTQIHASWLPRVISTRLRRLALEGLVSALTPFSDEHLTSKLPGPKVAATPLPARASTSTPMGAARASEVPRPQTHDGLPSRSLGLGSGLPRGPRGGAAAMLGWRLSGRGRQSVGDPQVPRQLRGERWTPRPCPSRSAWADHDSPTPRPGLLPGLAVQNLGHSGATSAINWGLV